MSIVSKILVENDLTKSFYAHSKLSSSRKGFGDAPVEDENHLHYAHNYLLDKGFELVRQEPRFGDSRLYHYAKGKNTVSLHTGLASAKERINKSVISKGTGIARDTVEDHNHAMTHLKSHFGEWEPKKS